ncbi:heat shock protein 90, partial [Balamuthia mandrillaris]
ELVTDEEKYSTFWKNYSTNIKYGVIEDVQNRSRLAKLLRFVSSKTGELASFDDYISRMKDGQEQIYYLSGENTESLKNSPLLEKLLTRGYEVLFMTDPIDEYTMSNLNKYDSKYLLTNVAKGDLKLPEDEEEDNKEDDEVDHNTRLQPLKTFIKDNFSDKVTRVTISNRLTKSPFALVSESWGYSAAMEKVIKAQALSTDSSSRRFMPKPVLEVNPNHPIVIELNRLVEENQGEDGNNEAVRHTVSLLLETASLASGYDLEDPTNFVQLIHSMVQRDLNVEVPQQPQEPQGAAEEDDHRDEL